MSRLGTVATTLRKVFSTLTKNSSSERFFAHFNTEASTK